jgi:hypothetical protein
VGVFQGRKKQIPLVLRRFTARSNFHRIFNFVLQFRSLLHLNFPFCKFSKSFQSRLLRRDHFFETFSRIIFRKSISSLKLTTYEAVRLTEKLQILDLSQATRKRISFAKLLVAWRGTFVKFRNRELADHNASI